MLVAILGRKLEVEGQKLSGGGWFGLHWPFLSFLLYFGLLVERGLQLERNY